MLNRKEMTDLIRTLIGREINDLLQGDQFAEVQVVTSNVFDIVLKEEVDHNTYTQEYFTVRVTQQKRY